MNIENVKKRYRCVKVVHRDGLVQRLHHPSAREFHRHE